LKILDKVVNMFVKSESFGVLLNYYKGQEQINPKNYEAYIAATYKKNPYAYAAVKIISQGFARVDWLCFEKKQSRLDKRDEIEEHPILDILRKPNKYESGYQFRLQWMTNLLLTGNSYMEKISLDTSRNKSPRELYNLRTDRMTIIPGDNRNEYIKGYKYKLGGQEYYYDYEKIRHTKLYNPTDDFYGLSPIEAAASSVDLNNLARDWNKEMLNNGGQPSMFLKTDAKLTDTQRGRLESLVREKSSNQKGMPWVLEGGLEMKPLQMNAIDMAWVDANKLSAREISIIFGVPPEIMGDAANKTYNNYKESRKALYEETIIPHLELFKEELNNWLVPLFGGNIELDYDVESIGALQEDSSVAWEKAEKANFITVNEKRNLVGYDDIEDGDVILVPQSMIGLGEDDLEENQEKIRKTLETEDDEDVDIQEES
jgi:HK97 family phage portal protein